MTIHIPNIVLWIVGVPLGIATLVFAVTGAIILWSVSTNLILR